MQGMPVYRLTRSNSGEVHSPALHVAIWDQDASPGGHVNSANNGRVKGWGTHRESAGIYIIVLKWEPI